MSVVGFDLTWSVGGREDPDALQKLSFAFERFGDDLTDFSAFVWPKVLPALEEEELRQFEAEGNGASGGWAALSPKYAERKEREWPGKPILERTGALREALTSSESTHARRIVTVDQFDFGTDGLEYASFHQLGTHHMPARPPFDFGDELEQSVQRAALEGVREALAHSELSEYVELSE